MRVSIRRLPHGAGLALPAYASPGAAGMDLASAEDITLPPGGRHAISTGFALALPDGYEAQLRPRSGLALRHGITLANTPGTIDADYRGELKVILANHGDRAVTIGRGDRIAQMVIAPVVQATLEEVADLDSTDRGESGFGSTGGHNSLRQQPQEGGDR